MMRRPEKWRRNDGCRLLDPNALAREPITILGEQNFLPYCPGVIVDTPYTHSVYELETILRSGLSLGNALDLPYPAVDSLTMLTHARGLEMAYRRREDEEAEHGRR